MNPISRFNRIKILYRFAVFLAQLSLCIEAIANTDKPGAKDGSLIGRIPGSYIKDHYQSDYDEILLPLSNNSRDKPDQFESLRVAGEQELIIYGVPQDVSNSVARIFDSIEEATVKKKVKSLYSCRSWIDGCGHAMTRNFLTTNRSQASQKAYRYNLDNSHNYGKDHAEFGIFVGETLIGNRKVYLLAIAGKSKWSSEISYSLETISVAALQVFTLTEAHIKSSIEQEGKAILSGLLFDTNSDELKSKSQASLAIIAEYIKAHPGNYLVVGHTDFEGSYMDNQHLSENRAASVVKALVNQYGLNQKQFKAVGVSFSSPRDTNLSATGREQNRRVELVPVNNF